MSTDARQSDTAYDRLKAEIILGRMPPGSEHTETGLAERFGLGRAAIRVALIRLSEIGLVSSVPRRGFVVAPVTARSVKDLFETRLVIEPKAAALATGRVDPEHLARLNDPFPLQASAQDRLAFLEANRAFHLAIAEATGNRKLTRMVGDLLDEMSRLLNVGLFGPGDGLSSRQPAHGEAQGHHDQLIAAFRRQDAAGAEAIATAHIQHAYDLAKAGILEGAFSVVL